MALTRTTHRPAYFVPRSAHASARHSAVRPAALQRAQAASLRRIAATGVFAAVQLVTVLLFSALLLLGPGGAGPLR
jgi:hypothetical protein